MIFYTITTFRKNISDLTKKTKDGYQTVMTDIRNALSKMPDNVLVEITQFWTIFVQVKRFQTNIPGSTD